MDEPVDRGPTIVAVESFPLEHTIPGGGYGCAKFIAEARTATLIKIETSDGAYGWGEALGNPRLVAPFIEHFGRAALGTPVTGRQNTLLNVLARNYHLTHGGPHVFALSGLDIAMWDAQARGYGVPVSDLLGGQVRSRIPAYASTGYLTPDGDMGEFTEEVQRAVDEGFTAVKIRIGTDSATDRLRAERARDLLGSRGALMVDYNTNGTLDSVRRSIDTIRDLDISWFEEPLPPEDLSGWAQLRQMMIPLSGGESLTTRYGFRDAIVERRFDIHQPDLAGCGGLTEGFAIAQLCIAFNSRISPHCWGSAILQAATLQLLAALPETPFGAAGPDAAIFEFDRGWNPQRDNAVLAPITLESGSVTVPTGPGLGVEADEDWLRAHRLADCTVTL
ncbi:mandelate racemase/muconate lactonizing enzyme family protein [Mycolicibacterium sp. HK-90]|uniref:mandelate racemase/muconate lactonizing enzyme family protein n=1 Tax=Mycolicibacterium sp. HK-90 TaxID=3056937 RepID=UPI002659B4D4|nr:mandelate racemase/muconate lactonizing enzyme family protein [Mycolicibacterium sp. HK-90]WKG03968.1 mandelate racemase/muconate lactonizing enzyme family protein [Mycolicibacterium sp. HK-90]